MIKAKPTSATRDSAELRPTIGTVGRLAIFAWSLALVMFAPPDQLLLVASIAFLVNAGFYPSAVRRLLRWRWLLFACLLILPSALWLGEADYTLFGISISLSGLESGLHMALRGAVVLLAVDGLSSSVDVGEVAGLLERVGMPGLGFSMGVAVNLLPALRKSGQNTWHSLRMRGGFRQQWLRALQLLLVTVVANALRRAEEIALAAEVRGFSPERSRTLPIKTGRFDLHIVVGLLILWLVLTFVT